MRIPVSPPGQRRQFAEHGLAGAAFKQWKSAVIAFKAAQRRGADADEVERLRLEAVRRRNALTVDERSAGGRMPDDLLRCLLPAELRLDETAEGSG